MNLLKSKNRSHLLAKIAVLILTGLLFANCGDRGEDEGLPVDPPQENPQPPPPETKPEPTPPPPPRTPQPGDSVSVTAHFSGVTVHTTRIHIPYGRMESASIGYKSCVAGFPHPMILPYRIEGSGETEVLILTIGGVEEAYLRVSGDQAKPFGEWSLAEYIKLDGLHIAKQLHIEDGLLKVTSYCTLL